MLQPVQNRKSAPGRGGGGPLRTWAIVVGVLLLGFTVWLVIAPVMAYRELGPNGRKASCGSVVDPLEPYATHDETCFDALAARRVLTYLSGGAGVLLVGVPTLGRPLLRGYDRLTGRH